MTRASEFIFWLGVSWLGYVYVGYPFILWFLGLFRSFRPVLSDGYFPKVSVLLSARNEQEDLGWKVAETLSWNYPADQLELLVASDASEDDTDRILQDTTDRRLRYLRLDERKGKNEALNRLSEMAGGELLFFSDANSHIEPDCLSRMVRYFSDPRVGCVTGSECTIRESEAHAATAGIRASLGYEGHVNTLESRMGSVLVCDGSIFCVRRSLFHRLQGDLANDLELPIYIGAGRHAILFDPSALSFEKASPPKEEFRRKQRICAQGALGLWRLRRHVTGLRAWQFYSRKLLRWFGLIPFVLILISSLALIAIPFYAAAFALQVCFLVLALIGWGFAGRKREGPRITGWPFYFMLVNVGALSGVLIAICGKRFSVWESPANSRGSSKTSLSTNIADQHREPVPYGRPELHSEKYRS
jgi:cellulose synthase/poly-beta-1,6-N-acetylglucosamine synthase-like glycosyltransferase